MEHNTNDLQVENSCLSSICSYCCNPSSTLKRCTGCRVPYYCSVLCQKDAWKSGGHKAECSIYKDLPGILPTETRALMSSILRKKLEPRSRWIGLERHVEELKRSERWESIVLQARAAVSYTKTPEEYMGIVVEMLCRVSCDYSSAYKELQELCSFVYINHFTPILCRLRVQGFIISHNTKH